MKEFPPCPSVDEAPAALFDGGHVWLHELVDGAPVRFQVQEDGRLRFGDAVRVFDDVPSGYEHVARHVRERFDRDALREATDDVESVVFFGFAMHYCGTDYDWVRTPPFLGSDVWSGSGYLLPDRVEKIYDRLGLDALDTVAAEVRAVDFDPDGYAFPASAWYDGPVAGVLVRDKTDHRARLDNPEVGENTDSATTSAREAVDERDDVDDPETFARRHVTPDRFDAVADSLRREGRPVTFDALYERTVELLARAHHDRLFGRGNPDVRAVRSEVAALTRAYLDDRE
ncbi:hypothetical protein [Salinigranum sp. GCM10025319]|uniref:hypothetical protein n=1 Tax=Salinigranum sp. GCM10025319 TaxID=3252687 RepID=UPI00361EEC03